MNYSELSDFDINMRVADAIEKQTGREIGPALPDYCNLSSNAWPIIVENGIGLMPFKNEKSRAWDLSGGLYAGLSHSDKNPLRAAMVVYLMMQEQKA